MVVVVTAMMMVMVIEDVYVCEGMWFVRSLTPTLNQILTHSITFLHTQSSTHSLTHSQTY